MAKKPLPNTVNLVQVFAARARVSPEHAHLVLETLARLKFSPAQVRDLATVLMASGPEGDPIPPPKPPGKPPRRMGIPRTVVVRKR